MPKVTNGLFIVDITRSILKVGQKYDEIESWTKRLCQGLAGLLVEPNTGERPMSVFYNSTTVKRLAQVTGTIPACTRNKKQKFIIAKNWSYMVLCFFLVVGASGMLVPRTVQADNGGYLFDKVITWADGSTEHVQIGKDGFFRLNGEKRRLMGMFLDLQSLPTGDYGQFYLPSNMAMYEKELAYLRSIGVRLIHFELGYVYGHTGSFAAEQKAYKDLLDLVYR
jgi:hypothetical protein